MNLTPSIAQTAPTRKSEAPAQRNARLLLAALAGGMRIYSQHGLTTKVSSGHTAGYHEVWCHDAGATRTESCTCEWAHLHGDVETYNRGTRQVRTNGTLPCSHMLVVRWYNMGLMDREAVISRCAALLPYRVFGFVPAPAPALEPAPVGVPVAA